MQCPSCRGILESNVRFCGHCGHQLPARADDWSDNQATTEMDGKQQARIVQELQDDDPFIGKTLNNRFHIESKIGEGGFGAVYRGTQKLTGRKVAIKVLHPDQSRDQHLLKRFQREGQVLCKLRDAHSVTTYDFDQTSDGLLYIAMELLEGRSLYDVFREETRLEWKRMIKILSEMCSSLGEAHELGIVHRDLKPENVYLEQRKGHSDFVKILDFGIAKVLHGDGAGGKATQLTATGQTLGTLEYMSPEQLMGKQLDGRSDVYALGVLTYEMITGRLPYPDAKGPAGLITAQLRQVPEPPSVACPAAQLPPSVDQLVLKMLAEDKADRFLDVGELRDACRSIMEGADSGRAQSETGPTLPMTGVPGLDINSGGNPANPGGPPARRPGPVAPGGVSGPRPSSSAVPPPRPGSSAGPPPRPGSQARMSPNPGNLPGATPYAPPPQTIDGMQSPLAQPYGGAQMPGVLPQAQPMTTAPVVQPSSSRLWLWIVLAIIVAGGVVGAVLALA